MAYVTKDSGERTEFGTGSVRDTEADKLDYTLLPFRALSRFVALLTRGAAKYGRHNWTKGQSMARAERSLFRHLIAYQAGQHDEDHMAAVVFNACVILDHEERIAAGELPERLDDRDEHRCVNGPPVNVAETPAFPINECRFCVTEDYVQELEDTYTSRMSSLRKASLEPDDHHPIGLM